MGKNSLNKSIEYEAYFKSLGKPDKDIDKIFNSMKDVYMLALVVGFKYGKKKEIKRASSDPIKLSIFDEHDRVIMDIIALYENIREKDLSLLRSDNEEEKYKLIEEYANGGMEVLIREICNKGSRLQDLRNFAESFNPKLEGHDDILDVLFSAGISL